MRKQRGYIAFTQDEELNENDCINLSVKFEDQETIDAWVAEPVHDKLVTAIDKYRSKPYFNYVYTSDENIDREALDWNTHEVN